MRLAGLVQALKWSVLIDIPMTVSAGQIFAALLSPDSLDELQIAF